MSFESRMAERRNELLEDLVLFVEQRLMEYGEPIACWWRSCQRTGRSHADHWGGQDDLFSKDHRRKLCLLEIEITTSSTVVDNYGDLALKCLRGERGMRKLIAR